MEHKEMYLNTTPDSNDIWKELGGNYENAEQTINELVDNAVSNLIGNAVKSKKIQITLEETNDIDQAINIYIEDSGLGIANAEQAFTLGKTGTDSVLNEHGFGLLQALSAANERNDSWDVYKRSSDNRVKNEVMHIMAPYVIGKQPYELLSDSDWPGHEWGNTLAKVRCDFKLFQTLLPVEESVRSSSRYYKANITSSGVELRINGRAMEYNKFEEIFGIKNHPQIMIQMTFILK